jgi:hypothetical protein
LTAELLQPDELVSGLMVQVTSSPEIQPLLATLIQSRTGMLSPGLFSRSPRFPRLLFEFVGSVVLSLWVAGPRGGGGTEIDFGMQDGVIRHSG